MAAGGSQRVCSLVWLDGRGRDSRKRKAQRINVGFESDTYPYDISRWNLWGVVTMLSIRARSGI